MLPGLTAEEARDLIMSVGTHHGKRRISPVEAALLIQKALKAGCSVETCAQVLGFKDPTMVSWFLKLLKVDSGLHHLIGWGRASGTVSFIAATEIGSLNEDEQKEAFDLAISNQLSKLEVFQAVQLRKRSKRRISECVAEVTRMRPIITRKHVFLGAIVDEKIRNHLAKLKQSERDDLLSGVIAEIYGKLSKTSARLGVDRFTIVTDEKGAAVLQQGDLSSFEPAINQSLASKVPVP
jgi:hypothetical protein